MRHELLKGLMRGLIPIGLLAGGCGPAGRLTLVQPQMTGWQREVHLQTDTAHWARAENTDRILAEFPLPGARTGRPMYLLYLRLPAGAECAQLGPNADAGARARGFFIQIRGEYAGLAQLSAGQVHVSASSPFTPARRKLIVRATCEDGTVMEGELTARRDDYRVSQFKSREHRADVDALMSK